MGTRIVMRDRGCLNSWWQLPTRDVKCLHVCQEGTDVFHVGVGELGFGNAHLVVLKVDLLNCGRQAVAQVRKAACELVVGKADLRQAGWKNKA